MRQPAFARVSRMSASGTASKGAMTPLTFSPENQYRNQRAPGRRGLRRWGGSGPRGFGAAVPTPSPRLETLAAELIPRHNP
jgi:hypothetical protein